MTRPRVVWLIDSTDPAGSAVMALRRVQVLRARLASTVLALSPGTTPVPPGSALAGIARSSTLSGEVRIARADVVVSTTERTLVTAAPRVNGATRHVHFLQVDPSAAFRSERMMRTLPSVCAVVVPSHVDRARFARTVGLPAERVVALDDFTLPAQSYLGTAEARIVLAPGRFRDSSGLLELAEAFRLALPDLPDWQLRVAGWGRANFPLEQFVDNYGLHSRIQLLGPRHILSTDYLDAGVVVRLNNPDLYGLPVLEALTAGVPVIAAVSVPATRRFLHDGENGLVLERTDPGAIAEALVAMADARTRADLAHGARSRPGGTLDLAARARLERFVDDVLDTDATLLRRAG